MKSRDILVAGILSIQALCGLAENQQPRLEAKAISIQDAEGGVQKLIKRGLLKPIDDSKRKKARRLGRPTSEVGTRRTRILKGLPKGEEKAILDYVGGSGAKALPTTGRTGSPRGKPKAGATKTIKLANDEEQPVDTRPAAPKALTSAGRAGTPKEPLKAGATETIKLASDEKQPVDETYDTQYQEQAVDEYYYDTDQGDDYYGGDVAVDDPYYDNSSQMKRGKKSGKKSSAGYHPIERVPLLMEAFQDTTSVTIIPVFSETNLTMPGTVFLYSDTPFQNKSLIGSGAPPSGVVQGSCSRTDPLTIDMIGYEGKAYCHFVYEFFDIDGQTVIATLTAEGPVANGDRSSLAITGGSGELRRTIGQIDLYPSTVDYTSDPPTITNSPSLDFLGDGMNEGYEMFAYLFVDPAAVLY